MEEELAGVVAALEERVRRLEERSAREPQAPPAEGSFWALDGLKERAPHGGVVFAGAVTLPTGEYYEWQHGVPADDVLDPDWGEAAPGLAATLGALGHPVRLLILGLALGGARSVADLQQNDALGTTGQLYHHIRNLVSAGWLRTTSRGHYAVPPDRVIPLLVILAAARR